MKNVYSNSQKKYIAESLQYGKYKYWPLENLTEHLVTMQNIFLEEQVPLIKNKLGILGRIFSQHRKGPAGRLAFFRESLRKLCLEMSKDHDIVFPYIRELADCHFSAKEVNVPQFSSLSSFIHQSLSRHMLVETELRQITEYAKVRETEGSDLSQHGQIADALQKAEEHLSLIIGLKFHVLFRRAAEMENTVGRCIQISRTQKYLS